MLTHRLWLPVCIGVVVLAAGCGSSDTPADFASATAAPAAVATTPPIAETPAPTVEPLEVAPTATVASEAATVEPVEVAPTATVASEAATVEPVEVAPTATVVSEAATVPPSPTAAADEPATPRVEELDPMESVPGGSVNRVYLGSEYPPELASIVNGMIDDAAARSGLDASQIEVVAVADVTWSDASLGCGQPGFSYAQVVTDGMRVVLIVGDLLYDYRASGVDAFVLCSQSPNLASSDLVAGDVPSTDRDDSSSGLYEITEDGEVVQVEPPVYDEQLPTEGTNPPDE